MTKRGAPQFPLRFPDEAMRDRIKAQAKANRRTMNAEILHRLEVYEQRHDRIQALPPAQIGEGWQ